MKKSLLTAYVLIFTCCFGAFCQDKGLKQLTEKIKEYALTHRTFHVFDITGGRNQIPAPKAAEILNLQIENSTYPDSLMDDFERDFFKQNLPKFNSFYEGIKNIGKQGNMLSVKPNKVDNYFNPIVNLTVSKSDTVLTLGGLYYDYTLNQLMISEQDRPKHVVLALFVPFTYNLKQLLEIEGIDKICLIGGFVSKDLSDKYDHGLSETVAVVFTKETLYNFYDAEITENELLSNSDIYYTNKDMEGNLKKIEIK